MKDLDNMQKKFDELLERDSMNKYLEKLKIKKNIQEIRYRRFEKWLETNSFDSLMDRIVDEHNDNYIDMCYKNGYMPKPNNKLEFIIDYIFSNFDSIEDTTIKEYYFSTDMRFFNGYHFVNIHGQGVITNIYHNKELILNI